MEEGHQILGAGGPLGQCSRNLISSPDDYKKKNSCNLRLQQCIARIHYIPHTSPFKE